MNEKREPAAAPLSSDVVEFWRERCDKAERRSGLAALRAVDDVPPEVLRTLLDAYAESVIARTVARPVEVWGVEVLIESNQWRLLKHVLYKSEHEAEWLAKQGGASKRVVPLCRTSSTVARPQGSYDAGSGEIEYDWWLSECDKSDARGAKSVLPYSGTVAVETKIMRELLRAHRRFGHAVGEPPATEGRLVEGPLVRMPFGGNEGLVARIKANRRKPAADGSEWANHLIPADLLDEIVAALGVAPPDPASVKTEEVRMQVREREALEEIARLVPYVPGRGFAIDHIRAVPLDQYPEAVQSICRRALAATPQKTEE